MMTNMLTDKDLKKIGELIRDNVQDVIMDENLSIKRSIVRLIREEIDPVRRNLKDHRQEYKKDTKTLKRRMKKLDEKVDLVIKTFDGDIMKTSKTVDRIKKHLNLPELN